MKHRCDATDHEFKAAFETFTIEPGAFRHRDHLRLAYVYLCAMKGDCASATPLMRQALLSYLSHHGVDRGKYHETLTAAWMLAVRHFMARTDPCDRFEQFIDRNPILLDVSILQTHYSKATLDSDAARQRFVEPDLDAIPRYA